jgi:hypothetical protein
VAGFIGEWGPRQEQLHPRGFHGRWTRKFNIPELLPRVLAAMERTFHPRPFQSDGQASQYLFNRAKPGRFGNGTHYRRLHTDWDEANAGLQSGVITPSTQRYIDMMDENAVELDRDVILTQVFTPDALGFTPQQMAEAHGDFDGLLGAVVADKGYSAAHIGTSPSMGPGKIQMAIAVPKGTKLIVPARGRDDPEAFLDRDQNLLITRVDRNPTTGEAYIMAVVMPRQKNEPNVPNLEGMGGAGFSDEEREARIGAPAPVGGRGARQGAAPPLGAGGQVTDENQQAPPTPAPAPQPAPAPAASPAPGQGPPPRNEPVHRDSVGGTGNAEGKTASEIADTPAESVATPPPSTPTPQEPATPSAPEQMPDADVAKARLRADTKRRYRKMATSIPVADAMQEIEELTAKKQDNSTIAQHIRGITSDPSMDEVPTDERARLTQRLTEAADLFEAGKANQGRQRLASLGRELDLLPGDKIGSTVDYDPASMDSVADVPDGVQVEVLRPAIMHEDPDTGAQTLVSKGRVRPVGGTAEAPPTGVPEAARAITPDVTPAEVLPPVKAKKATGPQGMTPAQERVVERAKLWRGQERNDEERRIVGQADQILAREGKAGAPAKERAPRTGKAPMAKKAAAKAAPASAALKKLTPDREPYTHTGANIIKDANEKLAQGRDPKQVAEEMREDVEGLLEHGEPLATDDLVNPGRLEHTDEDLRDIARGDSSLIHRMADDLEKAPAAPAAPAASTKKAAAPKKAPAKATDVIAEREAKKLAVAKARNEKETAAREKTAERTRVAEEKKAAAAAAKAERAAAPKKTAAKKAAPAAKELTPDQQAAAEVQARADEAGLPAGVAALRAAAKEQGIRGFSTMRKEQLQRALLGEEVTTGAPRLQVVSPEKMVGHLERVDSDSAARTLLDKHTLKDLQALADQVDIDRKGLKLTTKDKLKTAILHEVRGAPGTDFEPVSPDEAIGIRDLHVPDGSAGDMLRRGLVEVDANDPASLRDESERLESHATQLRQGGDRVNAGIYQEAADRMGMRAQQISGMEEAPKAAKRAPRKATAAVLGEEEFDRLFAEGDMDELSKELDKPRLVKELQELAQRQGLANPTKFRTKTALKAEMLRIARGVRNPEPEAPATPNPLLATPEEVAADAARAAARAPLKATKKATKATRLSVADRAAVALLDRVGEKDPAVREEILRDLSPEDRKLVDDAVSKVEADRAVKAAKKAAPRLGLEPGPAGERVERLAQMQSRGSAISNITQSLANGGSDRALEHLITTAPQITDGEKQSLLKGHREGKLAEALDQLAHAWGLEMTHAPNDVVRYDPERHQGIGVNPRAGSLVSVIRPGFRDRDGDGGILKRAAVDKASKEEADKFRAAETRAKKAVAPGSVPGARAQTRVTNTQRADAFREAWDGAGIPDEPGRSASRSMAEIRDRVHSGDWSPEEGIRRLETDIDLNKLDLAEAEAVLRDENLDAPERADLTDQLQKLKTDIAAEEKASKFMRRYFRQEPTVTAEEAKAALDPAQQSWLANATPDEIRDGARQAGLGEVPGDTADEVFENALKKTIERALDAKRAPAAKKAAKKALPQSTPVLDPDNPDRLDVRQIGTGIDFKEEDKPFLDDIQKKLDAGQDPAAIARDLDSASVLGPRQRRAMMMDQLDLDGRIADAKEQGLPADQIRALEDRRADLKIQSDNLLSAAIRREEMGRRLSTMGRPAKKVTPRAAAGFPGDFEDRKRSVADIVDQGGLSSRPAPTGAQGKTTIETAPDGRKIVRKQFNAGSENKKLADAEELGPLVMDAVGIHAPAVTRVDDRTVAMEFIDGKSGSDIVGHGQSVPSSILDSDDARRIGLADYLTHSTDRNPGNWIQRPDGSLATVDHADMFLDAKDPHTPASVPWGLWGDFSGFLRGEDDSDGNPTLLPQVDVSKEDLALLRQRLTALRPEFAKRRRLAWHRQMMQQLRELEKRAAPGAKSRLAPAAPAPVASAPARARRVGPGGSSFPADMPAEERARRVAQIEARQATRAVPPAPVAPEVQAAKKETAEIGARLLTTAMERLEKARTSGQVDEALSGLTLAEMKQVAGKYPIEGRTKAQLRQAFVSFFVNKANFEVLTRGGHRDNPIEAGRFSSKDKIPNNWGTASGEVAFHDDGPVGQALLGLGQDAKLEIDGDSLENTVGRLATRSVRGQISSEQFIEDLKRIHARLPEGRAKQQLGSAIREIDTPKLAPLPLPAGTPAPMVELMEMLSGIPLARQAPRGRRVSAMEELQKIAQELANGERLRGGADTAMEQRLHNTIHESYGAEGKFEIDRAVRRAIEEMRQSRRHPG